MAQGQKLLKTDMTALRHDGNRCLIAEKVADKRPRWMCSTTVQLFDMPVTCCWEKRLRGPMKIWFCCWRQILIWLYSWIVLGHASPCQSLETFSDKSVASWVIHCLTIGCTGHGSIRNIDGTSPVDMTVESLNDFAVSLSWRVRLRALKRIS